MFLVNIVMTFKEYYHLNESHKCKEWKELVALAQSLGCTLRNTKRGYMIFAPKDLVCKLKLPNKVAQRQTDPGEPGIEPLKNWLGNTLQFRHRLLKNI